MLLFTSLLTGVYIIVNAETEKPTSASLSKWLFFFFFFFFKAAHLPVVSTGKAITASF